MQRNSLYCKKKKRQPVSDRKGIWSEGKRYHERKSFLLMCIIYRSVMNYVFLDFLSVSENAYTPYIVKKKKQSLI